MSKSNNEKQIFELRKELARYKTAKNKSWKNKLWLSKTTSKLILGSNLHRSVQNAFDGDFSKENLTDLIVGVIRRLTRIGLFAIVPTIFILVQTGLLFQQNKLILNQNERINTQSHLMDAQRKSSLILMLDNTFRELNSEMEKNKNKEYIISESLLAKFTALSSGFKPYRSLHGDSLSEQEYSHERSLLFNMLFSTNHLGFENQKKIASILNLDYCLIEDMDFFQLGRNSNTYRVSTKWNINKELSARNESVRFLMKNSLFKNVLFNHSNVGFYSNVILERKKKKKIRFDKCVFSNSQMYIGATHSTYFNSNFNSSLVTIEGNVNFKNCVFQGTSRPRYKDGSADYFNNLRLNGIQEGKMSQCTIRNFFITGLNYLNNVSQSNFFHVDFDNVYWENTQFQDCVFIDCSWPTSTHHSEHIPLIECDQCILEKVLVEKMKKFHPQIMDNYEFLGFYSDSTEVNGTIQYKDKYYKQILSEPFFNGTPIYNLTRMKKK